jgi:DNA-binding XRE family transcriptional regulator
MKGQVCNLPFFNIHVSKLHHLFNLIKQFIIVVYSAPMNNIASILEREGLSKAWLAKEIGKSRATVTLYSKNLVQPPLDVLFKIAKCLQVDPRSLIKVD